MKSSRYWVTMEQAVDPGITAVAREQMSDARQVHYNVSALWAYTSNIRLQQLQGVTGMQDANPVPCCRPRSRQNLGIWLGRSQGRVKQGFFFVLSKPRGVARVSENPSASVHCAEDMVEVRKSMGF